MKVVCVNNIGLYFLTIGKIYEALKIGTAYPYINDILIEKNDNGAQMWYSACFFKTMDVIREEKLNELLK